MSYWLRLKIQMAIGYAVFPRNLKFGGADWDRYQRDAVTNTDDRSFGDVLRHILAGTARQRAELADYLEASSDVVGLSTVFAPRRQR